MRGRQVAISRLDRTGSVLPLLGKGQQGAALAPVGSPVLCPPFSIVRLDGEPLQHATILRSNLLPEGSGCPPPVLGRPDAQLLRMVAQGAVLERHNGAKIVLEGAKRPRGANKEQALMASAPSSSSRTPGSSAAREGSCQER